MMMLTFAGNVLRFWTHEIWKWHRPLMDSEILCKERTRSMQELANEVGNIARQGGSTVDTDDAFLYKSPNANKCAYYSLFCSDMERVSRKFGLTLYRQIECLACLLFTNGADRIHLFFDHLLTLHQFPKDLVPYEFIQYCHRSSRGSVYSSFMATRYKETWTEPYPKAELAFALRVLLSIIVDANNGRLTKTEADKEGRQIYLCDGRKLNEMFAVAVLRGLIVPREFILQPIITGTFCKAVRDTIFKGDSGMNNTRIRGALENPSSSYSVFDREHVLTECIRSRRPMFWAENTADVFVAGQSFFWTNASFLSMKSRSTIDIIRVQSTGSGSVCKERTSEQDMKAFESISVTQNASVFHRWWEPQCNRDDCVLHFMEECNNGGVPCTELLFPNLQQRTANRNNGEVHWRKYISRVKMNANIVRSLGLVIADSDAIVMTTSNRKNDSENDVEEDEVEEEMQEQRQELKNIDQVGEEDMEGKKRSGRKRKSDALADAHTPTGQADAAKQKTKVDDFTKVKGNEKRKSPAKRNRDAMLEEYSIPPGPAGTAMFRSLVKSTINSSKCDKSSVTLKGKGGRSRNSDAETTRNSHACDESQQEQGQSDGGGVEVIHIYDDESDSDDKDLFGSSADEESTTKEKEKEEENTKEEEREEGSNVDGKVWKEDDNNEDDKEESTVHRKAATKVQATWKRYCCQSGYRKRLLNIVIVQNVIRCKLARSRFDRLLRSKPPRRDVKRISSVYQFDNLWKIARRVWQEKFGEQLPEIVCTVEACKGIGNLYTHCIVKGNNGIVVSHKEYIPSSYDEKMQKIPHKEGYAFTKPKTSCSAFLWWLICTQQNETSKKKWAEDILNGQSTRDIHAQGRLFCTMSKDIDGLIWIHYKERRMRLV
ncbi:MAG: hypothetical protein MZW92_56355 [Comamonadaceae bacterium]|nr:hypothetical protein [Comamonadaceae bacterium]